MEHVMSFKRLALKTSGLPKVESGVFTEPSNLSLTKVLKEIPFVVSDAEYQFELIGSNIEEFLNSRFTLDINGFKLGTYAQFKEDRVILTPYYLSVEANRFARVLPFYNTFGFVQIAIQIFDVTRDEINIYSDYFQVALRDNQSANDLRAMANFVLRKRSWFKNKNGVSNLNFLTSDQHDEIAGRFSFLKKAIQAYEIHFPYFSQHCKTRTVERNKFDGFEKLRSFDASTLQYIISHPEELTKVRSDSGICIGIDHYVPRHTLVTYRETSKATIENLALMAFLKAIQIDLENLQISLKETTKVLGSTKTLPSGYVSSTEAVFDVLYADWLNMLKEIDGLSNRLINIKEAYQYYFPQTDEPFSVLPPPTPVFLNEPHYHLFYELMGEWFSLPPMKFTQNNGIFMMLVNSRLYEYFVLAMLIENLMIKGYSLTESTHYHYSNCENIVFYDDLPFDNTFNFENGEKSIVLYAQPIIYGSSFGKRTENFIHLKRITKLTLRGKESSQGVYIPDFVIKWIDKRENTEQYFIVDAKYSTYDTVRQYYASELAFKYLLSIRPTVNTAKLEGLVAIYGKRANGSTEASSFWDFLKSNEEQTPIFEAKGMFPDY